MQKILTVEEMREVDRLTIEKYGIPSVVLMENAAHAAARVISEKLGGSVAGKSFLILCGKGNNGGDGAALARILLTQGANVDVHLFAKVEETNGEAQTNFEIIKKIWLEPKENYNVFFFAEDSLVVNNSLSKIVWNKFDVVIDALFGTGLNQFLGEEYRLTFDSLLLVIQNEKGSRPQFISLDIPSGLNANLSGLRGPTFQADLTVTFTAPKLANVLPPASHFNGELVTVNIGSPQELIDNSPSQLFLAEKQDAQHWLENTKFTASSYKKTRGHVLVIAGSKNMSGAAALCANAAMTSGVGLVTIATPETARSTIAAHALSEIMVAGVNETEHGAISEFALDTALKLSEKTDVTAMGCGLSSNEERTRNFVRKFVENRKTPLVIDADALNALAPFDLQGSDELPLILTPHIGEMRRLLGVNENFDFSDRVQIARRFAQKHRVILVLKGERTLIAEPGGKVAINPTGNAGLGKGGNGDTLAGIIASFVAQSLTSNADISLKSSGYNFNFIFETVVAALYIAGLAGDIAAKKVGMRAMIASDVREYLIEAFRELENE